MEPHRFQMIDAVLAVEPERITARALVPADSPVFDFHFPGYPLLPGTAQIEAMAQAGGWLMVHRSGFTALPVLGKVNEAKLRGMVPPGSALTIAATLAHDGSGYAVLTGTVDADGKRCAEAEVMLRILPIPNDMVRMALAYEARRIGLPGAPA